MTSSLIESTPVAVSVRVYRLLLAAYPSEFRREYGPHMLQLFRDCSMRTYAHGGSPGMLSLWIDTLRDFVRSVVEEHLQRETNMNRERFIRVGGWTLILGAILFTMGFLAIYWEPIDFVRRGIPATLREPATNLAALGPALLAIGLVGLFIRYGEEVGTVGKVSLAVGAIGGALAATALIEFLYNFWEDYWIMWYLGLGVLYIGLAVFGVLAILRKPLPRWNWLPLLSGVWVPILIIYDFVQASIRGTVNYGNTSNSDQQILALCVLFSGVVLVLLGYILQSDTHRENAIV